MPELTRTLLQSQLRYDPLAGTFAWIEGKRGRRGGVNSPAGGAGLSSRGYKRIMVGYRLYYAHRLAWLYMTGAWPKDQIDHINGVRDDNRWVNLRAATHCINQQNQRRAQSRSQTGLLGVAVHEEKFAAFISLANKRIYLGRFNTAPEAHAVYIEAKRRLHPGNTL